MQAQPRVTYVLLGLNLVLYLVGIGIALRAGGEASNQWFLSLAKSNEALQNGEIWRYTGEFLSDLEKQIMCWADAMYREAQSQALLLTFSSSTSPAAAQGRCYSISSSRPSAAGQRMFVLCHGHMI